MQNSSDTILIVKHYATEYNDLHTANNSDMLCFEYMLIIFLDKNVLSDTIRVENYQDILKQISRLLCLNSI